MKIGAPQRLFSDSQRVMNSQSDSRSRFGPKYSSSGFFASSFFFSSSETMRLKPVPTGSTNTRSVNASHDDSFSTSFGGGGGSVPSAGKSTRCGPIAPMWRYADEAPGPPLKTNDTGRDLSPPSAT